MKELIDTLTTKEQISKAEKLASFEENFVYGLESHWRRLNEELNTRANIEIISHRLPRGGFYL
ncbi:MAG: hypothetical protein HZA94_01660 [Candidatus Vogelbacteria bacterium]|nr:hypothetical protein [Candidatus Vogelbacteria bacterium]